MSDRELVKRREWVVILDLGSRLRLDLHCARFIIVHGVLKGLLRIMCPHAAAVEVEIERVRSIYCIDVGKFQHFVYCSHEDSRKNVKVLQFFL